MRNPERIEGFMTEMGKIWAENQPDWRFGQLMSNFFWWLKSEKGVDPFFPEEDQLLEYFKEYCNEEYF